MGTPPRRPRDPASNAAGALPYTQNATPARGGGAWDRMPAPMPQSPIVFSRRKAWFTAWRRLRTTFDYSKLPSRNIFVLPI